MKVNTKIRILSVWAKIKKPRMHEFFHCEQSEAISFLTQKSLRFFLIIENIFRPQRRFTQLRGY